MAGRAYYYRTGWDTGGDHTNLDAKQTKITAGPQASSVLVFQAYHIFKTNTLEACGSAIRKWLFDDVRQRVVVVYFRGALTGQFEVRPIARHRARRLHRK